LVRHEIAATNDNAEAQDETLILTAPSTISKSRKKDRFDVEIFEDSENEKIGKKYGLDPEGSNADFETSFMKEFLEFRSSEKYEISEFGGSCVLYIAGWVVKKLTVERRPTKFCDYCCNALFNYCDSNDFD
jgi:hypothetical protein